MVSLGSVLCNGELSLQNTYVYKNNKYWRRKLCGQRHLDILGHFVDLPILKIEFLIIIVTRSSILLYICVEI